MQVAVIGTASGLALQAQRAGLDVFVRRWRSEDRAIPEAAGIRILPEWPAFLECLPSPRVWLLDLVAGADFDPILDEASAVMEPGDVVVDPGTSWWCDTLRRWRRMRHRALWYVDAAGLTTAQGELWLVAGEERGVELALPVLTRLVAPAPLRHIGPPAAAHYLAAVQEAVDVALAQARREAVQLAEAFPGELDQELVRALWPDDGSTACGREAWVIDDALRLEAAAPLLSLAAVLRAAERLEECRSTPPPPRCGTFVTPEDLA
ncbi:6-phosphogluconate dehydrogenase, decarboxylating [bacterium HR40]|nr:6-phosphogluconate dehydrogenase, decarboxylating [bacterium HR40]